MKTAIYSEIEARNGSSFFAPPVAWATAHFTQSLIDDEGGIVPQSTGIIVASDECSLGTIRELARTAARGAISPLRFAGSSPSIVVGLPAIEQGIRGPSLCLTMPPAHATDAILAMVKYWIEFSHVTAVIVIAHHPQADGGHLFRGMIARAANDELRRQVLRLTDR